jgi:hypothetical protein
MSTIAFIPFVRRGLATGITKLESNFEDGDLAARIDVQVQVNLSRPGKLEDLRSGTASLQLIGPGDVVGLHTNTIVRVSPPRDDSDAEFLHFPSIEFDQPDLPWRYTPFAPATGDRLKPWMVLIVLSETDNEFTYTPATKGQNLPVVTIPPDVELPDLENQSWAWAHVQFHGTLPTTAAEVEQLLQTDPSRAVSRLMCPRVLEERKAYRAFLVPAFEHGRLAGLGQKIEGGNVADHSFTPTNRPGPALDLPVYYDWRFQTGIIADFEATVRSLVPSPIPQDLASRDMDVSVPGFKLPGAASTGTALPIGGALRPLPPATPPPAPPTVANAFVTALKALIEASGKNLLGLSGPDLVVAPPLYGRFHGLQTKLDAPGGTPTNPPWFFQLNSDPRNRTGAALGTTYVQKEQQDLMASAWRQLGSLKEANVERRALQVGRETFVSVYQRHVISGPQEAFLMLTGTMHARVPNGPNATVHSLINGSRVGRQLFDPQFRRFARSRGRIGRSQGRNVGGPASTFTPLTTLNDPNFEPAPEPPIPDGMATNREVFKDLTPGGIPNIDPIFALGSNVLLFWGIMLFCVSRRFLAANAGVDWWWLMRVMRFGLGLIRLANGRTLIDLGRAVQNGTITGNQVTQAPQRPGWVAFDEPLPSPFPAVTGGTGNDSADAANFRRAFGDQVGQTNQPGLPIPVLPQISISGIFDVLKTALHPSVTLITSIVKRLVLPPGFSEPADKLEPIMAAPDFPQPVWAGLRDISPEWILPGLDRIGPNTVGLCVPNQPFIEAYMVGLNTEMSRELLWNEYPTDQRGTYFRQFWDVRGNVGGTPGSRESIVHIHSWGNSSLGQNAPAAASPSGMIVLLVRGDVIRRYPNVLVYAAEVQNGEPKSGTELFPLFTGRLGTDVYFYGFKLDINVARGNPGRYFVLQEQPSEPRFDPSDQPNQLPGGSYVTVDVNAQPLASAASFAIDHYQPPTRVAIHASTLIPPQ